MLKLIYNAQRDCPNATFAISLSILSINIIEQDENGQEKVLGNKREIEFYKI